MKDSLSGVTVNLKVAGIQAAYKRKLDALDTKNAFQKRNWIILTCILLVGFIVWFCLSQVQKIKRKQAQTLTSLKLLTNTLIEKNTQLAVLEEQLSNQISGKKNIDNLLEKKQW